MQCKLPFMFGEPMCDDGAVMLVIDGQVLQIFVGYVRFSQQQQHIITEAKVLYIGLFFFFFFSSLVTLVTTTGSIINTQHPALSYVFTDTHTHMSVRQTLTQFGHLTGHEERKN